MVEKVTTGSEGIDTILGGGIPKGDQVILAGGPGAGKTLFCMEFLYKNAKLGINSALISLEETKEQIIQNVKETFSDFTDIDQLMGEGKLAIYDIEALTEIMKGVYFESKEGFASQSSALREGTISNFFRELEQNLTSLLKKQKAEVMAIDNLTVVRSLIKDSYDYRNFVGDMARILKNNTVTSIIVTELSDPREDKLVFDLEFFAFDGIIAMYYSFGIGKKVPSIEVVKMRGTDHSTISVPYKITPSGIKLLDLGLKPE